MLGTYEDDPVLLDPWQVVWLRNYNLYRGVEKAPQIGWSWLCALEATWEAVMFQDATSTFVSVDLREASEKILYAKKAYFGLPENIQRWVPVAKNAVEEFWLGDENRPSRLISLPNSSGMRGRRTNVYLDETDFYRDGGKEAFRAGMGRITRGGRFSMGSTCFGEATQLAATVERSADVREARSFSVGRLPMTVVQNPLHVERMQAAVAELDVGDAEEEYYCVRGGGGVTTFPAEVLRRQQHEWPGAADVFAYQAAGPLVAGYDPAKGTGRHPAMLTVLERVDRKQWMQVYQGTPVDTDTGKPLDLPHQREHLRRLLKVHKGMTLVLDAGGLGADLSQSLVNEFGDKRVVALVVGSNMGEDRPPSAKSEMALALKLALESDELTLITNMEQLRQFHRTKVAGTQVVQPGAGKTEHYDRFWSAAYAWYGSRAGQATRSVYERRELIVIGGTEGPSPWE